MPEIKWFGHACFGVRGQDVSVVLDPVPSESGYEVGLREPDIVMVSHAHQGHNATSLLSGDFRSVTGPGEYEIREVLISGVETYHDERRGADLGKNTAYLIEIEELQICHLGDLGHVLSENQVEALSSVDVLMIPVGGPPTIDATQAIEIIGQLDPAIIIPMQQQTEYGDFKRDPVDRFLREMGVKEYEPQDRLVIRKSDLGESSQVIVLNPVRS